MSITEYIIPNLEFFSEDPLNLSIEDNEYLEVSSINPIEQNDVVEFRCLSQPMTFKSLSEIYLKAEVQILKSDSTVYTDADLIQPTFANNALFSMIKSASVYLNNVQVVNLNETFAQKHIIESYCNIDKMSCKSRFVCQGLFQPEKNDVKSKFFANSQIVSLKGKLNILNCDRWIIPGVDVLIKLVKHHQKFFLIEGANKKTDSKVVLRDLKLEIRHIKTREHFNYELENRLAKGWMISYQFKSGEVTSFSIPSSSTNYVAPAVLLSYKPSYILACFVKSANFLGTEDLDPHLFEMNNLSSFGFLVNGRITSKTLLTFKNSKLEKKYTDVFINLFRSLDIQNENCNSLVNFDNFPTHSFFLAQDLTGYSYGLTNVQEPNANANIGFTCVFETPLKEPLTVLIYALKTRCFKLNALRKVMNHYEST